MQGSLVNVFPSRPHVHHDSSDSCQCRTDSHIVCYRGEFLAKQDISFRVPINMRPESVIWEEVMSCWSTDFSIVYVRL